VQWIGVFILDLFSTFDFSKKETKEENILGIKMHAHCTNKYLFLKVLWFGFLKIICL